MRGESPLRYIRWITQHPPQPGEGACERGGVSACHGVQDKCGCLFVLGYNFKLNCSDKSH